MKKSTPEEIEHLQQAMLEREVEEELHKERLLKFWQKYRILLISVVLGIILITVGTEVYRSWYQKVRLYESDQFEQAILLNYQGKQAQAEEIFKKLSTNARTGYKYLSKMRLAAIYLNTDKKVDGLKFLKDLIDEAKTPEALKSIARLSYVANQIDSTETSELEKELEPLLSPKNAYYVSAIELKMILLLSQNKQPDAIILLKNALMQPELNLEGKKRLTEFLSVIEEQETK